jgi:hypothetical protein
MTRRPAAWIVGALAVVWVLTTFLLFVGGAAFVLAVPIALAGHIRTRRRPIGHPQRDVAERLVSAAATLAGERSSSDDAQVDWSAALRAELATITVPRERRRFALGAAVALLGRPHSLRSYFLAAGVAVAFGAGLLGASRAAGRHPGGLGSVTMLLPPVMLFAIGYLCARSTRSLRFGLETGILAALTTLVAVAVVYGVEAAHLYDMAPCLRHPDLRCQYDISVLDGDRVDFDSTRAAVLDAVHPVILLVHLVFWSPWPVLGAVAGARAPRAAIG